MPDARAGDKVVANHVPDLSRSHVVRRAMVNAIDGIKHAHDIAKADHPVYRVVSVNFVQQIIACVELGVSRH